MVVNLALPRWVILLIDLGLCLVSLAGAYQLRFNFDVPGFEVRLALVALPVFLAVRLATFLVSGTHKAMVRYTSTSDARRIFLTVVAGSLLLAVLNYARYFLYDRAFFLPTSVVIIDAMGTLILLIALRVAVKLLHLRSLSSGKQKVQVLIHGAGEAGLITKRTLEREGTARYAVAGFVDDDVRKVGKRLEGAMVYGTDDLARVLDALRPDQLIIAIQNPDPEHRRRVVDACLTRGIKVLNVPPVADWIGGRLSPAQIREVRIEDLLGRPVIQLEETAVRTHLAGKRILVTGAAGSIGSELVRQLLALGTGKLMLVDNAESALYDLDMELVRRSAPRHYTTHVGDVRDEAGMRAVMTGFRPEVVFHAAAYKHVPLMEAQPEEAIRTNVSGTRTVAALACELGVERFVLISTDKAVNPTSVMGASKRIAEQVVHALAVEGCATRFVTTRFGNVLGSNGSVIPLFRHQIAEGGPVTVTHPEVTRFFMTIPEACRLVLEAAAMGQGGEIYLFDMGQPMRIADLAERMIRLSGKEPGTDIAITYTGLRPGEKLYEELLATQENSRPTHHPRILIGQVREMDPKAWQRAFNDLLEAYTRREAAAIVQAMKALVPEYHSQNSPYANFGAPLAAEGKDGQGSSPA
ncbi:MAG: polysaccharide biosynthesis protein [Flavobacteriales bacterium]|nr:polysaccharide biosynthesis protein [Flavobacteriales bacterium]